MGAGVLPAAAWHGKLPSAGDFVSRRMDAEFLDTWDAWLSEGMQSLHAQPSWLDTYLESPLWHFLLRRGSLPGRAAAHHWLGILMPSVDRVGRYYPLTAVYPLDVLPEQADAWQPLLSWQDTLATLAADALHDDWSIEHFDNALLHLGPPDPKSIRPGANRALAEVLHERLLQHQPPGQPDGCLWYHMEQGASPAVVQIPGSYASCSVSRLLGKWPPAST